MLLRIIVAVILLHLSHHVTAAPCPTGGYCPPNPTNVAHCECSLFGGSPSCGSLTEVSGDWDQCGSGNSRCSVTDEDVASNLIWLGGSLEKCVHESCRWRNMRITGTVRFSSTSRGNRLAGILFRAQRVFRATNGPDGEFDRLGYNTYMLAISPQTGIVELLNYRWDGSVQPIPPGVPFFDQIPPMLTNQDIQFSITVENDDVTIVIHNNQPIKFTSILKDFNLRYGSVGLFTSRQVAEFRAVKIKNLDSKCQVPCPVGTYQDIEGQTTASSCKSCTGPTPPQVPPGFYLSCERPGSSTGYLTCPIGYYCPSQVSKPIPCPPGTVGIERGLGTKEEACEKCKPGISQCHIPGNQPRLTYRTSRGFYIEGIYDLDENDKCKCYPTNELGCGFGNVNFPSNRDSWGTEFPLPGTPANSDGVVTLPLTQLNSEVASQKTWWGTGGIRTSPYCSSYMCGWSNMVISGYILILPPTIPTFRQSLIVYFRLQRSPENPAGYSFVINPVLKTLELWLHPWFGPSVVVASVPDYRWPINSFMPFAVILEENTIVIEVEGSVVISWTDVNNLFPNGSPGFGTTAGLTVGIEDLTFEIDKQANEHLPCSTRRNSVQLCHPGTYQDQEAQTMCLPCPPGFYGCDVFGSGYSRDYTALVCEPGYYCTGGAELRMACPAGTFSDAQSTSCSPCPAGSYSELPATAKCQACPPQHVDINQGTSCKVCNSTMFSYQLLDDCEPGKARITYNFTSLDPECARLIDFGGDEKTVLELECTSIDAVSQTGNQYLVICLLSLGINTIVLVAYLRFWKNPLVKASQRGLSLATIIGAILTSASLLIEVAAESDVTCSASQMLPILLVTFTIGCMVSKIRRAHQLLNVEIKRLRVYRSTAKDMTIPVVFVVAVQLVIITVWGIVDAPVALPSDMSHISNLDRFCVDESCRPPLQLICTSNGNLPMVYFAYGWIFLVLVYCCILAWQARNLTSVFAEAKLVAFTVYTITFVSVFLLIVDSVIDSITQPSQQLMWAFGIAWISTITVLGLFAPKIFLMATRTRGEVLNIIQHALKTITAAEKDGTFDDSSGWNSRSYAQKLESAALSKLAAASGSNETANGTAATSSENYVSEDPLPPIVAKHSKQKMKKGKSKKSMNNDTKQSKKKSIDIDSLL